MPTRRTHRGLTLIELISVVVILGLVSAIVLPHVMGQDDPKVTSAARELTADIGYAQSCAISTARTHYVVFDAGHGKYALMDSLDPPSVILHPVEKTPYEVPIGSGALRDVTASAIDFDGQTTLAFDAMGTPYACNSQSRHLSPLNAGTIVLTSGESTRTICIQPLSGQVKVK